MSHVGRHVTISLGNIYFMGLLGLSIKIYNFTMYLWVIIKFLIKNKNIVIQKFTPRYNKL